MITQQNNIAKKYGLQNYFPILDELQYEQYLQLQQDIYHIMACKTLKLFKLTVAILSPDSEQIFLKVWKLFEYSHHWSKLSNSISHIESFIMSDCLRLGMVILFILYRLLDTNCFKPIELAKLQS
ncbi:HCP-like protein [Gigaspora margarita]|uniref:HCP-like protein n=1 Tax=Gigaspora margarita TaxID=4874 RepID=A0A8H4B5E7_GIGMA|nr:HCP-like protein [Gigaspora margarita]